MSTEERYQNQIRFFSQSGDGEAVQQRLARLRVAAFGAGVVAYNALSALTASGVSNINLCEPQTAASEELVQRLNQARGAACQHTPISSATEEVLLGEIKAADAVVVCLDAPAPTLMQAVNLATLRTKTPWVNGQIHAGTGWIGPTIVPGQTPCYACYEFRRNANLPNYDEVIRYETRLKEMPSIVSPLVAPAPLAASVGVLLALEALRLLTGIAMPQTAGRLMRIDFFDSELTYHRILRLPNCPACSNAS